MSEELEMLGTNILVTAEKTDSEPEKTEGGIFMPGTAAGNDLVPFEVLGVGPGGFRQDGQFQKIEDIEVGDRVIIDKHTTNPVRVAGKDAFIVGYRDILAKVKK